MTNSPETGRPKKSAAKKAKPIIAWKGFTKDLSCNGHAFEVGKSYTHKGKVQICSSGFHACLNPLDVWSYYGLESGNRFCRVQLSGTTDKREGDSKLCAETIYIETEVTLGEMIREGVKHTIEATKGKDESGDYAQIGSSGNSAQIGSSDNYARIGSSGYSARIGSSGNSARIGSSGDSARIGSSGDYAQIGSSGDYAQIGSSGYGAQIGSSGHSARIGSSGHYARIGSSGYGAQIGSSGHYARIGSSGHYARINATGENAVIASAGYDTIASGADGTWVSLAEFDRNGRCVGFATGQIGKDGLKPNTPYVAKGGKLVEAA